MVVFCITEGCSVRAGFGMNGTTDALYCKKHATSGMIDIKNKKCSYAGCTISANYNLAGLRAQYCVSHKTEGMICVTKRSCAYPGCRISPSFNITGEKRGMYCEAHKLAGMINVISKQCIFKGCTTYPTFNSTGATSGLYCAAHKINGMINVTEYRKCDTEGCSTRPTYGYMQAIACAKHKKSDMRVFSQDLCKENGCMIRANYNYEEGQKAEYCSKHKLVGMINVKDSRCLEENCNLIPSFNASGQKKGLYCARHKKVGMINVRERTCKTLHCLTQVSDKYRGYCLNCFIHLYPDEPVARNYKTKEKAVQEFIRAEFPRYAWVTDKSLQGATSRRRPDLCVDLSSYVLMIEIDENQHMHYDCTCQNKRIMELSVDVGHRPIIFIRFNPDKYIDSAGNLIASCWRTDGNDILRVHKEDSQSWNTRLSALKETVHYWITTPPGRMIEIVQLFYDQC
jgi:hypothetical protein